jgi:dethiobiotin synthetase
MKAFITATGTDIGKTYVTCGLLRHLRSNGDNPVALKPVASGFNPMAPAGSDPSLLLEAQGRPVSNIELDIVSPWRFAAPLSPDWAAADEDRAIDYRAVLAFCRSSLNINQSVLIEGVGGVMVPLDPDHTILDLMTDLALPVILVTGSYLGTLSHTLTALAVLQMKGLRCVAVVSETVGSCIGLERTRASIENRSQVPSFGLGRADQCSHDACFADIVRAIRSL